MPSGVQGSSGDMLLAHLPTSQFSTPENLPALPRIEMVALGVLIGLLTLLGLYNPRLFHVLAELICVATAAATFLVIWNARAFVEQGFFMILGLAFLGTAAFDIVHLLGTNDLDSLLLDPTSAVGYWAAGHILLGVALCSGSWRLGHKKTRTLIPALWVGGGAALLFAAAVLLTTFSAVREQDVSFVATLGGGLSLLLFLFAAAGLWHNKSHLAPSIVRLLLLAFVCLGLSGVLIDDLSPLPWLHIPGHDLKVLGYCLACRAIVVTGISRPYTLLFGELDRREHELGSRMVRLTAQARAIFDLSTQASLEAGEFRAFAVALLTKAMAVLGVSRCGVWVLSPAHDSLLCLLGSGAGKTDEGMVLAQEGLPTFFQAIAHERCLVADNAQDAPLTNELAATYLIPRGITSLLAASFRFSGRAAGVLNLEHTGMPRRWTDDEQVFAGSLADMLSLALETAERRRAAKDLAESEQRLRSLIDAMPDPVCFKDADGRWIVANQAQVETFGLTGTDWRGATDSELAERTTGDRSALDRSAMADRLSWESGKPHLSKLTLGHPDGVVRHFEVIRAPVFQENGQPKGLVVLSRDLTAHQQALDRLREFNEELEAIYNETSDGLIIADAASDAAGGSDYGIVRVNAAACRLFAATPLKLAARPLWSLHPAEAKETTLALLREIASGRRRLLENIACRTDEGALFYADIALQPITYAGRPAILGFYRDITSRRAVEEAVKASEDRFRKIFNSSYDAIFLLDSRGAILDVNDKMLELFGVRRDEAASLSFARDYSSQDNPLDALAVAWSEVMAGQERFFEWKSRRPHDGSIFYTDVYLRHIALADRHVILANVRDVTERKRVLAALAARQEDISNLNRDLTRRVRQETEKNRQKDLLLLNQTRLAAMGEMIGNIAHQWRQPLNALSILLANMRFDCEASGAAQGAAMDSYRQANDVLRKMSTTIDDFRNFFRPNKERETFRVVAAIADALLLVDASLAQSGIAVRFTARHDPEILGFRGEFSQVVLNLLSNAKDAITQSEASPGIIAIRVMARADKAVIHIRDNGGGIRPDIMERMFDPYFTTKNDQGGTGLGLYMSRIIITDHLRGTLEATNTADGVRFTIRIPLRSPDDRDITRPGESL